MLYTCQPVQECVRVMKPMELWDLKFIARLPTNFVNLGEVIHRKPTLSKMYRIKICLHREYPHKSGHQQKLSIDIDNDRPLQLEE